MPQTPRTSSRWRSEPEQEFYLKFILDNWCTTFDDDADNARVIADIVAQRKSLQWKRARRSSGFVEDSLKEEWGTYGTQGKVRFRKINV